MSLHDLQSPSVEMLAVVHSEDGSLTSTTFSKNRAKKEEQSCIVGMKDVSDVGICFLTPKSGYTKCISCIRRDEII